MGEYWIAEKWPVAAFGECNLLQLRDLQNLTPHHGLLQFFHLIELQEPYSVVQKQQEFDLLWKEKGDICALVTKYLD